MQLLQLACSPVVGLHHRDKKSAALKATSHVAYIDITRIREPGLGPMLGRTIGHRQVPGKVRRFGENAPPRTQDNMLSLGCNVVEPAEASPSFCSEAERFLVDAAAAESARRQNEAMRKQVLRY